MFLYYQNVRGVRTKLDSLLLAVMDCNYDIVMLTETGLDDCIDSLQIFGHAFNVFRCDRNCRNSNKSSFGGVLIAVHRRFASKQVCMRRGEALEQVFVEATVGPNRLFLGVIYIPPDRSCDADLIDEHVDSVRELCDYASCDDQVLICGDYNQRRLQWSLCSDGDVRLDGNSSVTPASAALIDGMDFLNLFQANYHRNHNDRTLDLVFRSCNCNPIIDVAAVPLLPVVLHHPPLEMMLSVESGPETNDPLPVTDEPALDFGKINYDALREYFSAFD